MQVSLIEVSVRQRVVAGAVLFACLVGVLVLAFLPGWERFLMGRPSTCLMKVFLGVPCLACRGTRAAIALAHGNIGLALRYNPLAVLFVSAVVAYLAGLSFSGRRCGFRLTRLEMVGIWIAFALALLGNWAYVIWQGG